MLNTRKQWSISFMWCCNKFKEEIAGLKNALAKFTLGKNNLDIILGRQRCVFDKAGLGYNPENQQKDVQKFLCLYSND